TKPVLWASLPRCCRFPHDKEWTAVGLTADLRRRSQFVNPPDLPRGAGGSAFEELRVRDSSLEGTGFEISVPVRHAEGTRRGLRSRRGHRRSLKPLNQAPS